jgi:hypothetical protein
MESNEIEGILSRLRDQGVERVQGFGFRVSGVSSGVSGLGLRLGRT